MNDSYHSAMPLAAMADIKAASAILFLSALEKVLKLQDHDGYLKGKRIMKDYLKVLKLGIYIETQVKTKVDVTAEEIVIGTAGHDDACTALRLTVEGNAYPFRCRVKRSDLIGSKIVCATATAKGIAISKISLMPPIPERS